MYVLKNTNSPQNQKSTIEQVKNLKQFFLFIIIIINNN